MKKISSVFLFLLILVSVCGCKKEANSSSAAISNLSTDSVKNEVAESLSEKLTREIDNEYSEKQKLPEYSTTSGMVELADKYADKWQQIAEEYYDKIMNYSDIIPLNEYYYSSEDLHTFVSSMKTNWVEYNQKQCDDYMKTLNAIYGDGTIVGPIFAEYKREMQKEWALQLVGIYQQLYAE